MPKIFWWKRLDELENELRQSKRNEKTLEDRIAQQKEQIEKLKSMLRGERVCDGYCVNCENHIEGVTYHPTVLGYGEMARIVTCQLDCKCPDFKRKETNT